MLLIGLQGYMVDGAAWAKRARIVEDIAEPLGMEFRLLDGKRRNWPAAKPESNKAFMDCFFAVANAIDEMPMYDSAAFLIGHSDGATMAARLALSLCGAGVAIDGVVSYAGVYEHFATGIGEDEIGDLPPALFLNNIDDKLVSIENMHSFGRMWAQYARCYIEGVQSDSTHMDRRCKAMISANHAWRPEQANQLIREWIAKRTAEMNCGS